MSQTTDIQIDTACKVAEEFTKLFYEALDTKRHTLSRFYMDNATLSMEGNPFLGKEAIQKCLEALPASTHSLESLDSQPVSVEAVKGQQTILILVAGDKKSVRDKTTVGYTQSFVITAQDNKWKIFSHAYRLQVPIEDTKPS